MTIKELAEKQGIAPAKIVDEFRRKYPEQKWTIDSELPFDFVTHYEEFEKTQPQESAGQVGEGKITTADDAIESASFKLNEAEKLARQQAIALRNTQAKLIGQSAGLSSGLLFMNNCVETEQRVLEIFAEKAVESIEEMLNKNDEEAINFAKMATECLGKLAVRETESQKKMIKLSARTPSLFRTVSQEQNAS